MSRDIGADEETNEHFGIDPSTPDSTYSQKMLEAAQTSVKPEFLEEYIQTFSTENIKRLFEEGITNVEMKLQYRDNEQSDYFWMLIVGYIYKWSGDGDIYLYSYRQNIDAQVKREEYMQGKAERDGLTGVYNKITAQKSVERMIDEKPDSDFTFIMLDIDDFKFVNDECGHAAGDEVLREISRGLQESFRHEDIIGRAGGDEFYVFTRSLTGEHLERRIKHLSERLVVTAASGNASRTVSVSIGVVVGSGLDNKFEDFYNGADVALYETKRSGKNGYKIVTDFGKKES